MHGYIILVSITNVLTGGVDGIEMCAGSYHSNDDPRVHPPQRRRTGLIRATLVGEAALHAIDLVSIW